MSAEAGPVTALLVAWGKGDEDAFARLLPLLQKELHVIARRCMAGQRAGHSLQPTALVNEAYLRLIDVQQVSWENRAHFLAVAARLMRRILVDHARAKSSRKRGGGTPTVMVHEDLAVPERQDESLVAVHDALESLTRLDERKGRIVELRFFGGLTVEEIAGVLNLSRATVLRDWQFAKVWLRRELGRSANA
jgi:RNA polymerase sigma factor (TIGR02999 family)